MPELETTPGGWKTIVADPPWPYGNANSGTNPFMTPPKTKSGRDQIQVHHWSYQPMLLPDLEGLPVADVVADDSHLYLWTTNAFMEEAYSVARAWGFAPKTILTWAKVKKGTAAEPSMKMGYYYRGASEHVLFCVRGSMRLQVRRGLPTWFPAGRLPHSVKPEEFYQMVEEASPGPYFEMFSRRARPGWTAWGRQVEDREGDEGRADEMRALDSRMGET